MKTLVFQGKTCSIPNSNHKGQAVLKNAYYRFSNQLSYSRGRLLLLPAVKVPTAFHTLPRPERVNCLVLDDSVIKHNRNKSVELLARIYDHVEYRYQKGFTFLTLGWTIQKSCIFTETDGTSNVFSKASKSFLKRGTEFQSRTYDAMASHTAIVFTRYTISEWIR